tara:strand:- start:912 stop:1205 length:294 start_codon:yes stop_codon:yes gene_type:complete
MTLGEIERVFTHCQSKTPIINKNAKNLGLLSKKEDPGGKTRLGNEKRAGAARMNNTWAHHKTNFGPVSIRETLRKHEKMIPYKKNLMWRVKKAAAQL